MEIHLYSMLRLKAGTAVVSLSAAGSPSVNEILHELARVHPALGPILFDAQGDRLSHLVIMHNGRDLRGEASANPELAEGDRLDLFLPVGGGSHRTPWAHCAFPPAASRASRQG